MRRTAFKRYVMGLAILVGAGLGLLAGFNALVNPFNLYAGPRIAGFNDYKYRLIKHQRLGKPAELERLRPDCLILGTSRMQIAMNPAHPGWGQCHAYNLALNNAGIYESLRYYQHAAALRVPRQVVLELEQIYGHQTQDGFAEERLVVNADGTPNPRWWRAYAHDVFASLVSWEALRASRLTVFPTYERRRAGPEDGFWEYTPIDGKMLRRGQRGLFQSLELEAFGAHRGPAPAQPLSFRAAPVAPRDGDGDANGYQYLRMILRLAHRDGVRMHLVIAPSHARLWNGMLETGGWSAFEARKRMAVYINEDEARRAGREPFPLWDFSGFNTYTTEPVPPADDRSTRMRWYWESQHFTVALGNRMLDRILGVQSDAQPVAADFGARLDLRNIESHLAAIRAAGDRWRQTHPQDVREMAELIHRPADPGAR